MFFFFVFRGWSVAKISWINILITYISNYSRSLEKYKVFYIIHDYTDINSVHFEYYRTIDD